MLKRNVIGAVSRNNVIVTPHITIQLYDVPVGFVTPLYFEAEYCLFCGRRKVAVARYRMICLVLGLLSVIEVKCDCNVNSLF